MVVFNPHFAFNPISNENDFQILCQGLLLTIKCDDFQEKQSWYSEQLIYQQPDMDHPNILHYIGVEQHGDNLQAEFWLITAFHEKGSLCDWLKANIVSWPDLCRIAESMAR